MKANITQHKSNVACMSGSHQVAEKNYENQTKCLSYSVPSYMDKYFSGGYKFIYRNSSLGAIKDIDIKSTVVIGAGPAGIMAALSVVQAGCKNVYVFVKRDAVDRIQIVTIYKNTLRYLKKLGVLQQILDRGCPITRHNLYFSSSANSKKYYETKINKDTLDGACIESRLQQDREIYEELTGESVLAISLSDLQDVLIREAIARGVNIYWGVDAEVCREGRKDQFLVKINYKHNHLMKGENIAIVPGLIVVGDGVCSRNAQNIGINYSIEETSKAEETRCIYHCQTIGNSPTLNYKNSFDQSERLFGCEFGLFYPVCTELGVAAYTTEAQTPNLTELAKRAEIFTHTQDASIRKVLWVSKPINVKFVRADTYSNGNAILAGDAAGVGSPVAGMGAVLAVSAYATAIEKYLKRRDTVSESAAREYNENVSSFVGAWQKRSRHIWSQIDWLPALKKETEKENSEARTW
jgi:2-polyprenyl-6-methoxyphenol hydroxylase-like FAD-dependent oxidoreductase